MMYWPRPHELDYRLSLESLKRGCEIIEADILAVDRCWRASVPDEYIPHTKTYHIDEIDQVARDHLLGNSDRVEIPEIQMLGNSHLAFRSGSYLFVLLREMADLGYMATMPFALSPSDADKFKYYFSDKQGSPRVEQPMLEIYGVA